MNIVKTPLLVISVFKNVVNDSVVNAFVEFLSNLSYNSDFDLILNSYSNFISLLYDKSQNQNLYDYVKTLIYTDENILSKSCGVCIESNDNILRTAQYELTLINNLLKYDFKRIVSDFNSKFPACVDIISHLPVYNTNTNAEFDVQDIVKSYKDKGYGIFSIYTAFKYTDLKEIVPVKYFNAMTFEQLKNYDYQKDIIKQNTKAFLEGKEANNILLYGDRGCGKSSTVKALINEFSAYNLKIIQVYKESFIYLSELYEQIRNLPLKFIIFADDISFDETDSNFSSIKAMLEGSLSDRPSNVIIYATTNRVHLVKECFSAREGNEVHCNDTIDETVSLSDRFGIMLTFSLLNKNEYLDIVEKIANDCSICVNDELLKKAEEFAALKAIRTPRVAKQFIVDYIART